MAVRWGKMIAEPAQSAAAAAQGFDFVQLGAEPSADGAELVRAAGVPAEVCAVPLPAEVRVTQRGFNLYVWSEHLKGALSRLAALGCRTLVWSEGRARVLPVEGEVAALKEQALQFLFVLCELAGRFDMRLLVEPLGPRRTNFINSLQELAELLPRVGKANVAAAISLRELPPMGLSPAGLGAHRELIRHVQLEDPRGPAARELLGELRKMGYAESISLAAEADAGALPYCRALWGG